MKRNPVQFQKGLSLNAFLEHYGKEEKCFDALFKLRWPDGFICPNCSHDKSCHLNTRKLRQCYRCHRQTSIIAGTIFESSKLPLTIWFQAIYLLTQTKKGISAMQLHRQLGISYNAAWRMKHKLMQVMLKRGEKQRLSGLVQMDGAYLGSERSGGKRGRGASGKTPFVAAVQTNDEGRPQRIKFSVVRGFRKPDITRWAEQHLTAGSHVISDGLKCFDAVTQAGCVHEAVITGGGRTAVENRSFIGSIRCWATLKRPCAAVITLSIRNMHRVIWQNLNIDSIVDTVCRT